MTTPTELMLSVLADHGCDPKQNGKGWSARCPAHKDRRPSLSIGEGDDGCCLLDCKAGCDTKDIVAVVGLTMRDLFPNMSTVSTSTQTRQSREKRQCRRQQNGKPQGKAYPKARDAVAALDAIIMTKEQGRRVKQWTYTDGVGEPPQAARFVVSDTTVEALAPLLLSNPRGLLLARDELAGWIGSFDRYAGGKGGADAAHWLSMHNGESIVVDRKTGIPRTIYVPQASVSVTGGIQPAILHRALGIEHRESGLAARLLLSCPPRRPKRWTEADIDPRAEAELARLFGRLYDLQPTVDDDGDLRPVVIGLTRDAKEAWKHYYNQHAEEQADLSGDLSAAWSKLEEYAARLALVIHYTRWAADDADLQSADAVDVASMKAGIELAQWFKAEARRVYALLSESIDDRDQRRLIEWIERKGGSVTAREVQQGNRQYRTALDAEAALEALVKAGCGDWEPTPPGRRGQPTRRFVLASTVYGNSLNPRENHNTVDVDSVDTPETLSDDEWGEL